jgi:hypothetical protein
LGVHAPGFPKSTEMACKARSPGMARVPREEDRHGTHIGRHQCRDDRMIVVVWTLPTDAKGGAFSSEKDRYTRFHDQKAASQQEPRASKADAAPIPGKLEGK